MLAEGSSVSRLTRLRRWTILTHRYFGIALSLLFVIWFVSGIGMIFTGGMPELTEEERLARLPALDLSRVRLSIAEASGASSARVVVSSVLGRPVYRFGSGRTVFADTGEVVDDRVASPLLIAADFVRLPASALRDGGTLTVADQWTIAQQRRLPLRKYFVDDAAGSQVYVSAARGEVVQYTTRRTRALAWVAAIPHWFYLAPLRVRSALWRAVVLWTAGLGAVTATLGLVLAVIQFSPCAPFRISRVAIYNPYSGWMRWHYVSGLFFGTLALTWVVSGLLSMQPGNWASGGVDAARIQRALAGGTLDLSRLAVPATAAVKNANGAGTTVKELEPIFVGGEPYWVVHGGGSRPIVVPERSLERSRVPFSVDAVKQAVEAAAIGAPAFEVAMLDTYDSYYYPRSRKPPLPVVRVKFDDRDGSWVYIDPAMGRVVAVYTRRGRIERWIYHGLHSLDLPFWYEAPSIRYGALVLLSLGGILLSLTGVVMAGHRVGRNLRHF